MDLPLQLQTAYQELMQLHSAEPKQSIEGSIVRRTKADHGYWVARKRVGDKVTEASIGPDTSQTRALVEAAQKEQERHKTWSRSAAACVSTLRAGRCLAPDMQTGKLLAAIAKTGFFAAGGILGGTQAFRHYPVMLSVEAPSTSFSLTGDVDLIASNSVKLSGDERGLSTRIQELGIEMDASFGLDANQPPKWHVAGSLELEFLSSVGRGGAATRRHVGIHEPVQALKHLEFSFVEPAAAVSLYRSGVLIKVPAPERYALHKLIVAQLRSGSFREKRLKDLDQAEWLIEVLAERRPYELWSAWDDLNRRGPKWRKLAQASIKERPPIRSNLDQVEEEFGPPDI